MRHILLIITLFLCVAGSVLAEDRTVSFTWDANPEPDIDYYNLYVGTFVGVYPIKVKVYGITKDVDLPVGVLHYAVVTAVNTSGLESEPSNLLVFQVFRPGEGVAPTPPVGLRKTAQVTIVVEKSDDLKVWSVELSKAVPVATSRFYRMTIAAN